VSLIRKGVHAKDFSGSERIRTLLKTQGEWQLLPGKLTRLSFFLYSTRNPPDYNFNLEVKVFKAGSPHYLYFQMFFDNKGNAQGFYDGTGF
jgi:hypothetical protein